MSFIDLSWRIMGNLHGVNRLPTPWGDVFYVKTQGILTLGDAIFTHRLGWPVFQPLQVKCTEERGENRAWKKRWELFLKEAAPWERSVFCTFQRSQLPSQTMQQKDFQRLKENHAGKENTKNKERRSPRSV